MGEMSITLEDVYKILNQKELVVYDRKGNNVDALHWVFFYYEDLEIQGIHVS